MGKAPDASQIMRHSEGAVLTGAECTKGVGGGSRNIDRGNRVPWLRWHGVSAVHFFGQKSTGETPMPPVIQ